MPYTPTGPFSNGGAPGISADFLNAVETMLDGINTSAEDTNISANGSGMLTLLSLAINTTAVSGTGTTAGSAQLYQFMRGTLKIAILHFNGYRNASATEQTIALPVAYTTKCFVFMATGKPVRPYSGGSPQSSSVRVITALAAGGGTTVIHDDLSGASIGWFTS